MEARGLIIKANKGKIKYLKDGYELVTLGNSSNFFVSLRMSKRKKHKTKLIYNNLNPKWEESFHFEE